MLLQASWCHRQVTTEPVTYTTPQGHHLNHIHGHTPHTRTHHAPLHENAQPPIDVTTMITVRLTIPAEEWTWCSLTWQSDLMSLIAVQKKPWQGQENLSPKEGEDQGVMDRVPDLPLHVQLHLHLRNPLTVSSRVGIKHYSVWFRLLK